METPAMREHAQRNQYELYYGSEADILDELESEGRVIFRYADASGNISADANPNGSERNIAGILSDGGNVLGMMPHPERAVEPKSIAVYTPSLGDKLVRNSTTVIYKRGGHESTRCNDFQPAVLPLLPPGQRSERVVAQVHRARGESVVVASRRRREGRTRAPPRKSPPRSRSPRPSRSSAGS